MTANAAKKISQTDFSSIMEMLKQLIDEQLISKKEADKTAQRIAFENKLTFIYLWVHWTQCSAFHWGTTVAMPRLE